MTGWLVYKGFRECNGYLVDPFSDKQPEESR